MMEEAGLSEIDLIPVSPTIAALTGAARKHLTPTNVEPITKESPRERVRYTRLPQKKPRILEPLGFRGIL
jgi:hypothetical protein